MYHPTTRVLTVLELLQARPQISGPELASRLEVDVRTVRRYITMLQDMGIPVEATVGRIGGYRLRPGFKLPPLMFSEDEVLVLTLGLMLGRRLGLEAAAPLAEGVLAKIERILPLALREKVQAMQETLVFDTFVAENQIERFVMLTIGLAAQQNCRLELSYQSADNKDSNRLFDPYGVVFHAGRWYTVGYCHLRAGLRVFRLDRVQQASFTTASFVRPTGFDCLQYLQQSIATIPDSWQIEVVLGLSLETARQKIVPSLAILEIHPEGTLLTAVLDDLDWLARFLVGLGCSFKVCQPPELRLALHRLADQIKTLTDL